MSGIIVQSVFNELTVSSYRFIYITLYHTEPPVKICSKLSKTFLVFRYMHATLFLDTPPKLLSL
ncbi:hypothetical protein I79_011462 [Cricetulus griseus]|uniref:Uncharacterized protein n=1 Tax=Cricetulus griseus TaxID=10029 RepID=G3HL77_CRIGR|nr:hypothetical protein I79_011462 [Cricetulus griseus]